VALLKGKQNYVCPRALEIASGDGADEEEALEALRAWAAADEYGDLDRFPRSEGEAFRRVRARVATDPSACSAATCRRARECFWARARRRAAEAKLVVVNHALLARASSADGLLPPFDVLVVDEAHRLEGVLSSQMERGASLHRVEELLRLTGSFTAGRRGVGLLGRMRSFALPLLGASSAREQLFQDLEQLSERADHLRRDAEALFARFALGRSEGDGPYAKRVRHREAAELLGRELQSLEVVLEHAGVTRTCSVVRPARCRRWSRGARLLRSSRPSWRRWPRAGSSCTTTSLARRCRRCRLGVLALAGTARAHRRPARCAGLGGSRRAPLVCEGPRAAVLTSATLSAAGDFRWAAERLGLGEEHGAPYDSLTVPSPFPLAEQMRAFVLDAGADEAGAIAQVVSELWYAARRNTLVLFTAHERLRRAHERLRALLPAEALLWAQDRDGPAGLLAERFRERRGAVLLGVQSLWEGVDFPGEALEVLVVARLPFSVPDDPVVEARAERLRERDLDPFRHDAVPEAVMRFRQGVGRLIRRATDRGVLVVCDPRLARASYRGPFRAALPVEPSLWKDPRELAREAGAFLAGGERVPMEEDP
jgi:Rad3-related DNA helicase